MLSQTLKNKNFTFWNNFNEIFGQYKWHSLSFNTIFLLKMTKKVSEVNVEKSTLLIDHNIVRMSVANTEYKGGNTVSCARPRKQIYGLG